MSTLQRSTLFALLSLCAAAGLPAAVTSTVRVNSVGLVPGYAKRATVLTSTGGSIAFSVKRVADNSVAFSGTLGALGTDSETSASYRIANFDSLSENGDFYVDVAGIGSSVNFSVKPDAYDQSYTLNLMGFYNQRCGMATSMTYKGYTWGHAACHMNDGNLQYYSGPGTKDGTGGWHDAGDFGKYVVNAAAALGPMLQAFERFSALQSVTLASGTNPSLPDVLEEAKWELDWMRKMQFSDGRVSHKLTEASFEAYPLMPNADTGTRYFVPWGSAATADFVAVMALASRIYQPYDAAYAASLLSAAQLSYSFLTANTADVSPDQTCCSTGPYTSADSDDRLWAAVEMWESTGDAAALTDAETRLTALGANKCDFRWDWADLQDLGIGDYALSARTGRNATLLADVRADIVTQANVMVSNRNAHAYGRSLGVYGWGYNGSLAGNCYILDVANRISPNSAYLDTAQDQLSWIYSRNYYNRSQVTGEGLNPPMLPHDRESEADGVVPPKPGHLVGGGHTATDWNDNPPSSSNYAVNEIAINWDGALNYALAMFYTVPGPPTPTPTQTPYAGTPTSTYTATPSSSITPTFSASPTPTPSLTSTPTPTPLCPGQVNGGKQTAGTSSFALGGSYLDGSKLTLASGGVVSALSVHLAAAGPFRLGFYTDNAGKPGTLLVETGSVSGTYGWNLVPVAGPSVAAGTYWIVLQGSGTMSATYTNGSFGDEYYVNAGYGAFPPIFPAGTASTWDWAAYVSVCPVVSPTPTATISGTFTRSPTSTPTASPSATPTASATGTSSPTATGSPSASPSSTESPSFTESPTATLTATDSPVYSPTPTATESPTASDSPSPSASASVTPSFSPSPVLSATPTVTATPTPSATPSQTASLTPSPSPTFSGTPSPVLSATPSLSPSPSPVPATATPAAGGPLVIDRVEAWPQPNPRAMAVLLESPAERVTLKVYTRAWVLMAHTESGPLAAGWSRLPLPAGLAQAPKGLYYVVLQAQAGGRVSGAKVGRCVFLP